MNKNHILWLFVPGDLCGHKFNQGRRIKGSAWFKNTYCLDGFSPLHIWNADNAYLGHIPMVEDYLLYLDRINILPAGFDKLFLGFPLHIPEIAIFVKPPDVPRMMPAVSESISRVFLPSPISQENSGRTNADFSGAPHGDLTIEFIEEHHLG